jgi:hypothetical protein
MRPALLLIFALLSQAAPLYAACTAVPTAKGARAVDHYITDNVLHRRWAVIVDCDHPERPWAMEEVKPWHETVSASSSPSHLPAPLIRAGAEVQLWRTSPDAHVNLRGIALDAGAEGQTIRVRVQHSTAVLEGKVRGAGSVELLTRNAWKAQ